MTYHIPVLVLAASVAATAAWANEEPDPAAAEEAVTMETDKLVAGRRAGFWMSAGLFGSMNGVIKSGGEVKGLAFAARTLNGWATTMPGLFPEGSVNDRSNALPAVWDDREGFLATAKLYQERTAKLAELAAAGDQEGFATQWTVVRQTCSTCHDTYRKKRD
ncbi:Cytochrome c556 [Parasphingorhabdus marina DSM 22363]|uniref:Cytochrome c556 n=1 Tax=Parasphingorhabdus marina DSM 22363 TaxID=1123272 RepID=A0A1N6CTF9_9SPHN|nr:cytochrome c [Parasphingorhabdus marina]SIN61802.1 Cytochrome c556 [Parasphingorhabdus marina DSM 22363]